MTESRNIREIDQLGVDWMGFIFYHKSLRYVSEAPSYLPEGAKRVGVFVNENDTFIQQTAGRFSLDYVQLHGYEPPEYCRLLKSDGYSVIKNFSIATAKDLERTVAYEGLCAYFLFDTHCPSYGGSGVSFDWNILKQYQGDTPFVLSGGIAPDSVNALKQFDHPLLAGYDINSRFETEPGIKNVKQIAQFIKDIRER